MSASRPSSSGSRAPGRATTSRPGHVGRQPGPHDERAVGRARGRPRRPRRCARGRRERAAARGVGDLDAHQHRVGHAARHLGRQQRMPPEHAGEQRGERSGTGGHAVHGERRVVRGEAVVAHALHAEDRHGPAPDRRAAPRASGSAWLPTVGPARPRRWNRPARPGAARRGRGAGGREGAAPEIEREGETGGVVGRRRRGAANPRPARAPRPRAASRRATPPGCRRPAPSAAAGPALELLVGRRRAAPTPPPWRSRGARARRSPGASGWRAGPRRPAGRRAPASGPAGASGTARRTSLTRRSVPPFPRAPPAPAAAPAARCRL